MNYPLIVSAIIVLLCYWRLRNLYYTRLAIRHRMAMFRLRDELRRKAIEGTIDRNGRAFAFLDIGLCFSIGKAERYNLFTFAVLSKLGGVDKNNKAYDLDAWFENEPAAHDILIRFRQQMREYFLAKHYFLRAIARATLGWKSLRTDMNRKADALASVFVANSNRGNLNGLSHSFHT